MDAYQTNDWTGVEQVTLSVRLPRPLYERLREQSIAERISMARLIILMLDQLANRQEENQS